MLPKFVVAGRDPAEVFELVEETLNDIAVAIEIWTEANRILAVGLWRNVCPGTSVRNLLAQPVGIIGFVGQQHVAILKAFKQFLGRPQVMRLARRDGKLNG